MAKKLFWKIWITPKDWSPKKIGWEYCDAILGGVLYSGPVLFGRGIVYSDEW